MRFDLRSRHVATLCNILTLKDTCKTLTLYISVSDNFLDSDSDTTSDNRWTDQSLFPLHVTVVHGPVHWSHALSYFHDLENMFAFSHVILNWPILNRYTVVIT